MKTVLLIGLGRFGRNTAHKLDELGHEVMAIDNSEERVNAVLPYVTSALIGDSTNEDFMNTIDVSSYDLCIVAIGDNFQSSLETTALLKELGAQYVVSRAARDVHAKFLLRNGADEIIYPEKQLAEWIAIRYSSEHIFDYIELDKNCSIFEIEIPNDWVGKSIVELNIRRKYKLNIIGIRQNGYITMDINPDMVLKADERLLVAGNQKDVDKCFR